jgi:hypothetical protein
VRRSQAWANHAANTDLRDAESACHRITILGADIGPLPA